MRRNHQAAAAALLLLVAHPRSGAAVEVSGTWLLRAGNATERTAITQDGETVTFVHAGFSLSGTVTAEGRLAASGGGSLSPPAIFLDGDFSGDGKYLNASSLRIDADYGIVAERLLGLRCDCVDGNFADGDGCDADCQVEPCWSCTGAPQRCVPLPDGSACDRTCSAGAKCSGGACLGGTPLVPCLDLSGTWDVHVEGFSIVPLVEDFKRIVRQRGTALLLGDGAAPREYFGRIDPATGALAWTRVGAFLIGGLCGPEMKAVREPFAGAALSGGRSLTASGRVAHNVGSRCPLAAEVTETAVRRELCGEAPWRDCATATGPTTLQVSNPAGVGRDAIAWQWRSASPTSLRHPLASGDHAFCIYDVTAGTPALLFRAAVPAGEVCGERACWQADERGGAFSYVSPRGTPDGVQRLRLQSTANATGVRLLAQGALLSERPLGLPPLPLPASLSVQLQGNGGDCFAADYGEGDVRWNDPLRGVYRAQSRLRR